MSVVEASCRPPLEIFNAPSIIDAKRQAPKVCELLEQAEEDLLAFMASPPERRTKLRATNPLESVNREIDRRSDVVGILPNDTATIRLCGARLIGQNDEWLVCRRYLSERSTALILSATTDQEKPLHQDKEEDDRHRRQAGRRATN